MVNRIATNATLQKTNVNFIDFFIKSAENATIGITMLENSHNA